LKSVGELSIPEEGRLKYWPNPAHKRETSEEGPPQWRPHKTPCPPMPLTERQELLTKSIPDPKKPQTCRYALRRGEAGLEWFEGRLTRYDGEEPVFHGYPTKAVPARVLRIFRDAGEITQAEYRRTVRQLG